MLFSANGAWRADAPVNPASTLKLVTTYAALDRLGPDFRWQTRVYSDGPVRDGTLLGDLYLQGGGDPKLVSERLWLLLRRVQGLGFVQPRQVGPLARAGAARQHEAGEHDHQQLAETVRHVTNFHTRPVNAGTAISPGRAQAAAVSRSAG